MDDKGEKDNPTIGKALNDFKEIAVSPKYFEKLKISILDFNYKKSKKSISLSTNIITNSETIPFSNLTEFAFDYNITSSYTKAFNKVIIKNGVNQKYFLIICSHSNGLGIALRNGYTFLTDNLNRSFKNSFLKNGIVIDGMMALNCRLQSIESNIIFAQTVNFFIGSQILLSPSIINYEKFFTDLVDNNYYNDELIFTKFLYDCEAMDAHIIATQDCKFENKLKSDLCISLTQPKKTWLLPFFLNELASSLDIYDVSNPQFDTIPDVISLDKTNRYCSGPAFVNFKNPIANEITVVIDAVQFFLKLLDEIQSSATPNKKYKVLLIQRVLNFLDRIVVLNISSGALAGFEMEFDDPLDVNIFLARGIGLFIPKERTQTDSSKFVKINSYVFKNDYYHKTLSKKTYSDMLKVQANQQGIDIGIIKKYSDFKPNFLLKYIKSILNDK